MQKSHERLENPSPHIFRANDIRGVFNEDFDLNFAKPLSRTLSVLLKDVLQVSTPQILLGHDARLTSPAIAKALINALIKEGVNVTFIGLSPSPLCYFLLHHYNLTATVIVTASHNPVSYNGFKIMIHKKFRCRKPIKLLKKIFFSSEKKPSSKTKGYSFEIDSYTPYINSLKKEFCLKPLPLTIDGGNGALGPLVKRVFKDLGLKPFYLFCEPDGKFPNHHPDPTVEANLKHLKKKTLETKSLFGVGFDGDGDRLGLITQKGRFVFGDEFGSLFLKSLLKKGGKIIADVKCSDWFFKTVKKLGGIPIMSKSGHSFAREELEKHQALLALEFSGHIFFNDRPSRGFDDALYNTLRLIELLNNTPSLETMLPPSNPYKTGEIRITASPKKINPLQNKIKLHLNKKNIPYNKQDGIRFSTETAWGLYRVSQTQSNTVIFRFEASSEKEFLSLKKEFSKLTGFSF